MPGAQWRYSLTIPGWSFNALPWLLEAGEGIRVRAGFQHRVRAMMLDPGQFVLFRQDEDNSFEALGFQQHNPQFDFTWTAPSTDKWRLVLWNESEDPVEGVLIVSRMPTSPVEFPPVLQRLVRCLLL